jgi:hypothetical protein
VEGVNNLILKRIGLIGVADIGVGVLPLLANTQHDVVLTEIHDDILIRTRGRSYQNNRLNPLNSPSKYFGKTPSEQAQNFFTTDYPKLHDQANLPKPLGSR